MHIICEGFTCPKDGASEAQNDDACFPRELTDKEYPLLFRCAVADGATESLFAGKWATRLTKAFCHGRFAGPRNEFLLRMIQSGWTSFLKSKPLPWYAAAKAEDGSFATLLGLELHAKSHKPDVKAKWVAKALGDSCLFLIRNDSLDIAIPLATPDEFNNQPHLIASNPKFNIRFADWLVTKEGDLRIGDTFYLMTDALSLWFVREHVTGNRPWEFLRDVGTDAVPPFSEWIRKLRAIDDRMNDDATMLRVEVQSVE
jgi:hypothetical protein